MAENLTLMFWILAFLMGGSAFFSGVEAAFLALTKIDIKNMLDKKKRWAHIVKKLKDEPHKLVITILIGNNLVNIAASTIAASIAIEIFESNALGISTGIMTMIVLIFGEITPKTLAIGHRSIVTRVSAWPIYIMSIVLYPIIYTLDAFTKMISRLFNTKIEEKVTEEEIKSVVSLGEESGSIEKDERRMINNILKFDDIEVSQIMTPRSNFFYLETDSKISEVIEKVLSSGKSRIPVIKDDRFIGVVFLRDMLDSVSKKKESKLIKNIMKKPFFVPEQRKIDDLLKDFQKKKVHIAIVVDEFGNVSGLVTIEDVLEQIVGEIYDETDKREIKIKNSGKNTYIVSGSTRIDKVNEKLKMNMVESEEYDTLSGFILKNMGRIPEQGETFSFQKFEITMEKVQNQKIEQVKIEKK